jgi:hypothetical protein
MRGLFLSRNGPQAAYLISFIVKCPDQGILSMGNMTDNCALLALCEQLL